MKNSVIKWTLYIHETKTTTDAVRHTNQTVMHFTHEFRMMH